MFATIQQLYTTNYTDQSDFDGQNSGHDYMGTVWHPSHGYVNNWDGARGEYFRDYKQA